MAASIVSIRRFIAGAFAVLSYGFCGIAIAFLKVGEELLFVAGRISPDALPWWGCDEPSGIEKD